MRTSIKVAGTAALFLLGLAWSTSATSQSPVSSIKRVETAETSDGRRLAGRMARGPGSSFQFVADEAGETLPLEKVVSVAVEGPPPSPADGFPPFLVALGFGQQISGKLDVVSASEIRLGDGPGHKPLRLNRAGVRSIKQRPGEVQVFQESFEESDLDRWSQVGSPETTDEQKSTGERSLKLPAGGSAITHRLPDPVGSGRFEIAFYEDGKRAAGQRWFLDLTFRGPNLDPEPIQAILGWDEESLAVYSPRGGPALAVQRLAREPGWHRLIARFDSDRIGLAVDGFELAHGPGRAGPLVEVRLGTQTLGKGATPKDLAGRFDDLRLVRFAEPVGGLEVEPAQDEVRLVGGDQLFGSLKSADAERVVLEIDGRSITVNWTEAAEVHLRRTIIAAPPIEGLWAKFEWRAAPANDARDVNQVEGALIGLTETEVTVEAPYIGALAIPRDRLRRVQVINKTRRTVLDSTTHHLGNDVLALLSPPQPEGRALEIPFSLERVDPRDALLALEVVQVVGESGNTDFSDYIKDGELRTNVSINGRRVDYLNRHIHSTNETPERIRIAIPAGVLKAGTNVIRFEQDGRKNEPDDLDDLGILGIAIESADPTNDGKPKP